VSKPFIVGTSLQGSDRLLITVAQFALPLGAVAQQPGEQAGQNHMHVLPTDAQLGANLSGQIPARG